MRIAPLSDLAVPAEVSGANPEATPSEEFESCFNVALGEGTSESAGTQGAESTETAPGGDEAEAQLVETQLVAAQPGDPSAMDALGAERIEAATGSVEAPPPVATRAPAVPEAPAVLEALAVPEAPAVPDAPAVPEALAPDPDGELPAATEIDPAAIQTPEMTQISNLGPWDGLAAAVPEAHDGSSQPGSSPAEVRARAVGTFRERTERLWGFWLRGHGGGSAGGAETLPTQVAAGPAAIQLPELEAVGASPPVSGSDAEQNPATLAEPSSSSLARSPSAADIPTDAARGDAGSQADSLRPAARPARAPADHALVRDATGPRAAEPAAQVAQAVRVSLARGGNRVTVRLEPESLGKVHVVLAREAGGVTAHFRVETPQAHQALQGDMTQLRQALESRGVPLVEVFVDLDHGQSRGESPWAGLDGRRRRSRPELAGLDAADEIPVRPATWRPWGFDARV
jgi:hypothetical protein